MNTEDMNLEPYPVAQIHFPGVERRKMKLLLKWPVKIQLWMRWSFSTLNRAIPDISFKADFSGHSKGK